MARPDLLLRLRASADPDAREAAEVIAGMVLAQARLGRAYAQSLGQLERELAEHRQAAAWWPMVPRVVPVAA